MWNCFLVVLFNFNSYVSVRLRDRLRILTLDLCSFACEDYTDYTSALATVTDIYTTWGVKTMFLPIDYCKNDILPQLMVQMSVHRSTGHSVTFVTQPWVRVCSGLVQEAGEGIGQIWGIYSGRKITSPGHQKSGCLHKSQFLAIHWLSILLWKRVESSSFQGTLIQRNCAKLCWFSGIVTGIHVIILQMNCAVNYQQRVNFKAQQRAHPVYNSFWHKNSPYFSSGPAPQKRLCWPSLGGTLSRDKLYLVNSRLFQVDPIWGDVFLDILSYVPSDKKRGISTS